MRLTSVHALASRQAPNRNPSADLALVSCSDTLACCLNDARPGGTRLQQLVDKCVRFRHRGALLGWKHVRSEALQIAKGRIQRGPSVGELRRRRIAREEDLEWPERAALAPAIDQDIQDVEEARGIRHQSFLMRVHGSGLTLI